MTLEYVILGHEQGDQGEGQRKLLLFNGALPSLDPAFYTRIIAIEPLVDGAGAGQIGLAIVEYDGSQMLLVVNQPAPDLPGSFTDHYVFIPPDLLTQAADQFESWLSFLPQATRDVDVTLPLLQAPMFTAVDAETRAKNLARILDQLPDPGFEYLLSLLGALIDNKQLLISGFPADFNLRLECIAGIQALLPGKLASWITFASSQPAKCQRRPQIAFVDDDADDGAWRFDWREQRVISEVLQHPFIEVLRVLWAGEPSVLAADIQKMALPDLSHSGPGNLADGLQQLAERFWVDHHVRAGDEVSTDAMMSILDGAEPPSKNLRRLYVEKLLENALHNRDSTAGKWVAEELERDEELDAALAGRFEEMLEDQPDAVYVFIRNRLINLGVDERWIPRLHRAAQNSLDVAIQEGDIGTLAGWLELIAHEPQSYQLHDILKQSVLSAAKRAYSDGELGIQLILIAARRVPEILADLYGDESLIAALETNVRLALQNASVSAIDALIDDRPEHFLFALYNGISSSDEMLVSAGAARRLIGLAQSEQRANLPAMYRAPALIRLLATEAVHQMSEDAVDLLLQYILHLDDREFIAKALGNLADHELLFPRLSHALEQDDLPLEKLLSVMNAASAIQNAPAQDVIACYFSLLDYYQWEPSTQRLTEALARLLAKHHEVKISYRHLWTLFDACQQLQSEAATRVVMTQLTVQFDTEEDLAVVVEGLARICRRIAFSRNLQEALNNWWRAYTHSCALPQLQRLQRELDSQRHLEEQKHIIKTVLAMRRWLHSRGPAELAEAINTAYIMLEHITEAFDSGGLSDTDPHTIRREVDSVSSELSSEQRHILANNLRNLANRITQMAENRSKPSLMRSDDSIDRQLMQGEANPQGSVDMLKWIAGYLDGAHPQRAE
ncbi:MAG: hypothetical protein OXG78_10585 [Chloroflexi bacterium]|nr:hypothetical protein [Chloroflexota bacterium]